MMFKKQKEPEAKVQTAEEYFLERYMKERSKYTKFRSMYNKTIRVSYSNLSNRNNQSIFKGKVLLWN